MSIKGVLYLRLSVRRNLVPAVLFLQGLLANSQVEDMCPISGRRQARFESDA